MKLLAEVLEDQPLKKLYKGLLAAEARHHQLYVDLALTIAPEDEVRARLEEIAAHEAASIALCPLEPRLHNR
jgi:tRNA 2-(methylsulfanyl)-N6-isopentenyladenosine37 hydroxylase